MQRDEMRGEVIEIRERLFLASALCRALADLAIAAPKPLGDQLEALARFARTAVDESIEVATAVVSSPVSAVAA